MATEHTSLALSGLTCQIPNISNEILSLIRIKEGEPLYKEFVERFLKFVPIDYNIANRIELFNEFTSKSFEFFKHRLPNKRKIEIIHNIIEDNPSISILLINDDKPFIVDALLCLLNKIGLQAKFILHPVISCVRESNGGLIEISDENASAHAEFIIYIEILGNFNEQIIRSLENEITETLDKVDVIHNIRYQLLSKIKSFVYEIEENSKNLESYKKIDCTENVDFLNWLNNDNFTFFGSIEFDTTSPSLLVEDGAKSIWHSVKAEIVDIITSSNSSSYQNKLIILGKINCHGPIHSANLVDYILIKKLDIAGNYKSGSIIIGQYSNSIYHQSVDNIPILRQKLKSVLDRSGFRANGHNARKLQTIIASLPKEALIQIDESDLYCMCIHMLSSMMSRKLKLFIQQDWSSSFVNLLIFLPRERLSAEIHNEINLYLLEKFDSAILSDYVTEVAQNFSYLFVSMEVKNKNNICFLTEEIEFDLDKLSTNWSESFYQELCKEYNEYQASLYFKMFEPIFPADYRHKFSGDIAIADISYLKSANLQEKIIFNLIITNIDLQLKIYSAGSKLSLSDLLPSIESLGFKVIDQQSFLVKGVADIKETFIYQFFLSMPSFAEASKEHLKANVEEALDKMAYGFLSQDSLSKLIVLSGFNWSQVKLLRAITRYLHQTGFSYGKGYVQITLIKHCKYTELLVAFFDVRFNPIYSNHETKHISDEIELYLETIISSSEDKVLRSMFDLIKAIVRTNLYQLNNGLIKDYISFKFDSTKIPNLPLPLPFAEIFVYSNEFEAVHLRGGKVARGGIRWSDRCEDYRTEALGLMKAQMTKNPVIVPVGSKGAFFVQFDQDNLSSEEYHKKGVDCYKKFLRGLLDITDNIIDGKIIHPDNTVMYDEPDPYLVVAADKGTGTFSDYANSISEEYGFWLGDAFASGGTFGYDHKKMAITSKGAWISARNHFQGLKVDVQKDPISVVGIGDMSGDVFGNGMLRSNSIKLVAAFNHKHIFIDPTPDPAISFDERARLFSLPRSNWSDYNPKLISIGGGIFERSAKSIKLSSETKKLLKTELNSLSPDDLIKHILMMQVDLIWNGGIGTYIKASTENHLEIGDKSNDNLRCDGKDIKAMVVVEGGNLGVSQKGRIEYSLHNGRINTDFIDNSAGVDCSDHEVNIKIALNQALRSGKLNLDDRNKLLILMTNEVEELVLIDNYKQTQAITIMQLSPASNIESFSQLIKTLEDEHLLDRNVEFLPDETELARRSVNKEQMTRPELAVLLSYSKMSIYNELIKSKLADDRYFESYLINYFPKIMKKDFLEEMISHPLRNEIIITVVTNKIVNQLGGTSVNTIKRETEGTIGDIVRAYSIICEIFDLESLWQAVESLPTNISDNIKIDMFAELAKIMKRGICWVIKNQEDFTDITKTINEFKGQAKDLSSIIKTLLIGDAKLKFENRMEEYISSGIDLQLAESINILNNLISVFDINYVKKHTNVNNQNIAGIYFAIGNQFYIDWLRRVCDEQVSNSYWDKLSIKSLKDDFYDKQRQLLIKMISLDGVNLDLNSWIEKNHKYVSIFLDFIDNIKLHENVNLHMLILANKKLELFLKQLG